jgi:signal transduction histidine kinase
MEAVGQLSGGIAHDFNNLLHVIRNAADLVQQRLHAAEPDVPRYLEYGETQTWTAPTTLTQRLLAFSRRTAPGALGASPPARSSWRRPELPAPNARREHRDRDRAQRRRLPVFADPGQLETALLNLAINARDAMAGSGKLTIEISNAFLDETYAAAPPGSEGRASTRMIAVSAPAAA